MTSCEIIPKLHIKEIIEQVSVFKNRNVEFGYFKVRKLWISSHSV